MCGIRDLSVLLCGGFAAYISHFKEGCPTANRDIETLKEQISRLMAALEDVNFECQRLEIVNTNLDFQLKEANRELAQNIAVLQSLEEENEKLREMLKAARNENGGS